jgi:large subunit ribosomal protein L23
MRIQDIIRRPLITEKSTELRDKNVIAFEVSTKANKIQIKKAVEAQFKRKVTDVRVARFAGKERRQGKFKGYRPEWKKAYVRLAPDEKPIEFFEGM